MIKMWAKIKKKISKWWWAYADMYTIFIKGYTYTWSILVWRKFLKGSYKNIYNFLNKYFWERRWYRIIKKNIIIVTWRFFVKLFFLSINKIDDSLSKILLGRVLLRIVKAILSFIWKWRVNFIISGIIPWTGYGIAMYTLLKLIEVYGQG